ncbi:Sawadee protein [Thalictrum thalictroides]|uniref:Sawadee protein n=1 Tax=Thalictrum thalictroides TaxID=46969 RepID=A0A7J6WBA2_THATH|nr:Sawadee protein [Thalictrum thalictroides]
MTHKSFSLDFHSWDKAWYTVRLVLQGETLFVKYCNFTNDHDESYSATLFKDSKELEAFIERFRPTAIQLQDHECRRVIEGMTVCASYEFGKDDIKFHDAVVEAINFKDHKIENEEVCTCTFQLFWINGANAGNRTDGVVADICLLQPGDTQKHPIFSLFLEIAKKKLKATSLCSGQVSEGELPASHGAAVDSIADSKSKSPLKEIKSYKQSLSTARNEQDMNLMEDLKEASGSRYMLIENLEKDLPPSAIVDFVKKHVSISSQAEVFPSLSMESFTKGIITVDGQEDLQKIYRFLDNPSHIILSPRGRPWVITEKKLRCGVVGATAGNSKLLSADKNLETGDKIRIFNKGTDEYKRGNQLKELYLEFADHQRGLYQQFAREESMILQLSSIP